MNTNIQRRSETADIFLRLMSTLFATFLVESLLYGVHFVLFCICCYILFTRRNPAQLVILLAIILMFALATADVALSYCFLIRDVPAVLTGKVNIDDVVQHVHPKNLLYVTNNLIADSLLLYRCFMVWGGRKNIMLAAAAAVLLVADSVWGYLSQTTSAVAVAVAFTPVYFWSVFGFNIIMTLITAGRIWWIARAVHPILGKQQIRRYNTAIAILMQSGAIYSISVLLAVAVPVSKDYRLIFLVCAVRIVGIMPTLMIVQVELGRSVELNQNGTASASLDEMTTVNRISIPLTPGDSISISSRRHSFNDETSLWQLRMEMFQRRENILRD